MLFNFLTLWCTYYIVKHFILPGIKHDKEVYANEKKVSNSSDSDINVHSAD